MIDLVKKHNRKQNKAVVVKIAVNIKSVQLFQ